ncbi:hypothetical protein [Halovivax gelatinilyticus]|uniref:hypothetical protein n=1 Tax=Halovivax gelatinilyticus TaxID=2961597 RepID=UPI0020CA793D|nr:hypothetical protein [Halovivax gelatinilyticus]
MTEESSRAGPPVEILPTVAPDDELELYFDRYNQAYPETPQSPVRTTVTDVTVEEKTEETDILAGTLRSVSMTVAEDDDKADRYWMEHRIEHEGDETRTLVSDLLYEDSMFSAMTTTGRVGHIDRIVVHPDASNGE